MSKQEVPRNLCFAPFFQIPTVKILKTAPLGFGSLSDSPLTGLTGPTTPVNVTDSLFFAHLQCYICYTFVFVFVVVFVFVFVVVFVFSFVF